MKKVLLAMALATLPTLAFGQTKDEHELQDRYFRGMQEFYNNNSYERSIMMQQSIVATQQAHNAIATAKRLQDEKEALEIELKFYKETLERARKATGNVEKAIAKKDDTEIKKWLTVLKQVIRH